MIKTNRVSTLRLIYSILIALTFIIGTTIICFISLALLDQYICLIAINICFILVFILLLTRKRLDNVLPENKYISYGKILSMTVLFWVIAILCVAVAPDFFIPIMIFPLLASVIFDDLSCAIISLYFVTVISFCQNENIYMLLSSIVLIMFGLAISPFVKGANTLEKLYSYLIIFGVNVLIPIIFYFLTFAEINLNVFVYSILDSVIVIITCAIFIPLYSKVIMNAEENIYDTLLDSEYSLQKDIHKFSFIEYKHASRVSRLSKICAEEINVNESLAAAGGFYYRLGKLEGEPMIDNAVKIANNHCFPIELINILSEYGGIISLPSSPESAIVHMVDTVVTKVELFDSNSMASSWNQNMVIYQTINELSQKGLYDNANLSMNQFLKIRERLAKENILA